MLFQTLALCLLFLTSDSFAQNRSPAVEDFVGIEVEHPESTPQGTEPLFNFEQDLTKHANNQNRPENLSTTKTPKAWSIFSIIGVTLGLGLPIIIWLMLMGHLRKQASIESASNIEVLEKYRKERELHKKGQESVRKVS